METQGPKERADMQDNYRNLNFIRKINLKNFGKNCGTLNMVLKNYHFGYQNCDIFNKFNDHQNEKTILAYKILMTIYGLTNRHSDGSADHQEHSRGVSATNFLEKIEKNKIEFC